MAVCEAILHRSTYNYAPNMILLRNVKLFILPGLPRDQDGSVIC